MAIHGNYNILLNLPSWRERGPWAKTLASEDALIKALCIFHFLIDKYKQRACRPLEQRNCLSLNEIPVEFTLLMYIKNYVKDISSLNQSFSLVKWLWCLTEKPGAQGSISDTSDIFSYYLYTKRFRFILFVISSYFVKNLNLLNTQMYLLLNKEI